MEEIKIENLTFTYPMQKLPALRNISLSVNKGEFIAVCGKSGCGKSTLLRRLKPLIAPHGITDGKVLFEGKSIDTLTQREQTTKIGFVLQNPDNQIVCDKVWHELAFGLENLGCSSEEIRARVAETASFFGIQNQFYKNTCELSGGQKQLLNLAAVMVMQPSVLILDEPTGQLDPIAAHDLICAVAEINREFGITVIISEHRLEEVLPLADRVIVMDGGKIIAGGTPREAGQILKNADSCMLGSFPTPMRIYYETECGCEAPLTVREGRQWLSGKNPDTDFKPEKANRKTAETALELRKVWFRYEKNLPDVLKDLSVSICKNEFYAIVGGNGTGKTTALSVMSGINKPYRGKCITADGVKIAALPQDPQNLFSQKTVMQCLYDAADCLNLSNDEKQKRIAAAASFCELGELAERHPYDLSGGEQQRTALATVLLQAPDILIMDEPTKGMDAQFKSKLAGLIDEMKHNGMTVIAVSHDIEFCAQHADRCGMFFDGKIVSEDEPRSFFGGKSFYTTAASRMARDIIPGAVLDTDILAALGKKKNAGKPKPPRQTAVIPHDCDMKKNAAKRPAANRALGLIFAVLCLAAGYLYFRTKNILWEAAAIVLFGISGAAFIPQKELGVNIQQIQKRKLPKRTAAAAIIILLLIPLTVYIGIRFLGDRKYYFISALIIAETVLPFALIFEGRKPRARETVTICVLCAIAVAGRVVFAPLPEFKPVVAIVIISAICFGGETGFLIGAVTGFVSNFFFGQGPWTPWQMFAFGIIGFISGILFQKGILRKTRPVLCIFGFAVTLIVYGSVMNIAAAVMSRAVLNREIILSYFIPGLPFDLVHATSTAVFLWLIAEPMLEKLERIKLKYGLTE